MELKIYNPQEDGFLQAIEWNFEELEAEITARSAEYLNLVYSDDQIKEAKKDRANLRKLINALEAKRKELKKKVMEPYNDFEEKEKKLLKIIGQAVDNIDVQVKGYEEGVRQEKEKKIKEIYKEAIGDLDRTVPLEKIFKESWLNVSTSQKSIKEDITGIHDKVEDDLKIINTENSPYIYEMKEEYLKSFDLMAAMAKKQELEDTAEKKKLFEEQRRREQEEKARRAAEEAARIANAGKKAVPSTAPEAKTLSDGRATEAHEKVRRKRITFAVTANEKQFDTLNTLLMQLKANAEELIIISKEEM